MLTGDGQFPTVTQPGAPPADATPLGEALESYRAYLTRVAGRNLGDDLTAKLDASDLVQETFLAAREHIATFRGQTPSEWRGWLEAILRGRLAHARRLYRDTAKRQVGREVPLAADGELPGDVDGSLTTPSVRAMRREDEAALLLALESLPEHYRLVVRWHHEECLTFDQIAARLGTTDEAARKLWGRAMIRLRQALGSDHAPL